MLTLVGLAVAFFWPKIVHSQEQIQDEQTGFLNSHFLVANYPVIIPTRTPVHTPAPIIGDWWVEEVYRMTDAAGMPRKDVQCAIQHESGWKPEADNWNSPYTDAKGIYHEGTWDIGLWQINDVHGLTREYRLNPIRSTQYAITLWEARGFQPWFGYLTHCT